MENCGNCGAWRYEYRLLEKKWEELIKELREERAKTEKFDSIKRERDELKRAQERSYDAWVTDPERQNRIEEKR